MTCNKNLAFLAVGIVFMGTPVKAQPLAEGHYDLGFDYETSGPSAGWSAYVFDLSRQQRLVPAAHPIVLQPKSRITTAGGDAVGTALGVPAGQPYWALPFGNTGANGAAARGLVYLGFRTEEIDPQVFAPEFGPSLVSLSLVSLGGTGPARGGHFAAFSYDLGGAPVFDYNSANGITGADRIAAVPVPAHSHSHWAFTKPGRYAVTLAMSGTFSPELGGLTTTGQGTFHFWVPASGLVESGLGVIAAGAGAGGQPLVHLRAQAGTTAYGSGLGAVLVPTQPELRLSEIQRGQGLAFLGPAGIPLWMTPTISPSLPMIAFSAAPAASPANWDVTGVPETVLNGLPGVATRFRLVSAKAPGPFAVYEQNGEAVGTIHFSGDKRLGQGSVTIPAGSTLRHVWAFARQGIHRLTFVAETLDAGGAVTAVSPPFEHTLLVGISAEHDYAVWADSWAAVAGQTASALADPLADPDGDGLNNRTEHLLAAHGFDPLLADAEKLPRPTLENGRLMLRYRRDTFRDWGSPAPLRLLAERSSNLATWSSFDAKLPFSSPGFDDRLEAFGGRIEERVIELENGFTRLRVVGP